jgi:3-hydroxyisobutyrate dehydrogenase-like beta-hydroxyacid dehydrogenase
VTAPTDVDVLVIMVTNEVQAEDVLYGHLGAVEAIPSGATVVLASTVSPAFVSQLERRLESKFFSLLDDRGKSLQSVFSNGLQ